jgi:hypothetical protein
LLEEKKQRSKGLFNINLKGDKALVLTPMEEPVSF